MRERERSASHFVNVDEFDMLVPGIVDGDPQALRDLYELMADRLASFAFRMLHDRGAAEEVAQQAFVELASAAPGFRGNGLSLRAWLFRSARFSCLDELRRRSRHPEVPTEVIPDQAVDLAEPTHLLDPELESALRSLTPRQQAILVLRHVEGLSGSETAQILGMSRAAVFAACARAEHALRQKLAAVESDDVTASLQVREGETARGSSP